MPFRPPRKLDAGELREYAMKVLSGRALTVAELKEKLRRRATDLEDIDRIVAQLKEYGALNDRRYAEHFSTTRAASGAFGSQRVLSELVKRKVASKVAQKAVREAYQDTDETALVTAWLERKYRNQNLAELLQDPKKLASAYRRLRQAGFASGPSIRVLKRFAAEADQLESLEESEPSAD
ncbi:MAG: RecX family transcriptional regulator [Acidobacteria bacterium]|nr:RecX family transcriptional regulator [Acidobacteriota bacterium]